MFSCRQIYDLVTEYDEGSLAAGERRQFEAHVVICPPCRGFLSQMRATREHLGHGPAPEFPPELEDSIVSAFQAWKQQEQ
jgi:anti-sigma factor ChrR (cupin superfamily)